MADDALIAEHVRSDGAQMVSELIWPAATRVLVIDGHPVTRWGIGWITGSHADLQAVGEAGTAAEAIALTASLAPDLVTMMSR